MSPRWKSLGPAWRRALIALSAVAVTGAAVPAVPVFGHNQNCGLITLNCQADIHGDGAENGGEAQQQQQQDAGGGVGDGSSSSSSSSSSSAGAAGGGGGHEHGGGTPDNGGGNRPDNGGGNGSDNGEDQPPQLPTTG